MLFDLSPIPAKIDGSKFSMAGKDKEDEEGRGEGEEEEEGAKRDEEELGLDDGTISGQVIRVACQHHAHHASPRRPWERALRTHARKDLEGFSRD
jgi:hypothetical protein